MNRLLAIINRPGILRILSGLYASVLIFAVFFTPNRFTEYNRMPPVHLIPFETTIGGLHRTPGEHFWSYYIAYFNNLVGNVVLFMPMGFLLKALNSTRRNRQIILIGALISIGIELLQLLFKIGVCDIDDVILNTLGTLCGVLLWKKIWNYRLKTV